MSAEIGLIRWKNALNSGGDASMMEDLIHEDAVFHSPVVHTPQEGRRLVVGYLMAASQTLGNDTFAYVREIASGSQALLEFTTEIDGIHVNGVDIITFNHNGQILDFKVMIRPLKAVNKVWEMMAAQLEAAQPLVEGAK